MKKFLSLVLALGLSISVLSAAVFAEDAPAEAHCTFLRRYVRISRS